MRFPDSTSMLFVATLVAAAVIGAVTPASAAAPATDVDYLNISRCTGLAEGMGRDASALKLRMADAGRGRDAYIYDRGAQMRADAAREARRAGDDAKRHLAAESDGACSALVTPTTVAGR